jgi:hypothetical protein
MGLIFSDADFALMRRVHDAFNPNASLNPAKIFPLGKGCGEIRVRKTSAHGAPSAWTSPDETSSGAVASNAMAAKPEPAVAKH